MTLYARVVVTVFVLFAGHTAYATPQWYVGVPTRVAMLGGNDFIMTLSGTALSDCASQCVYFRESIIGAETAKHAYAMALAALMGERQMGVIIDKAINGPGGLCNQEANMFDVRP